MSTPCPERLAAPRARRLLSIAQRLAGLQRMRDPLLRLRVAQERHELRALEVEQPLLVDEAARLAIAAAQHARDAEPDLEIVRRDEAAVAHVDEHHLERRDAGAPGDGDVAGRERRPVAR